MKPKVLAASWYPGGINPIIPVISSLQRDAQVDVSVVGYEYSEKILTDAGIKHKKISDYGIDDVCVGSIEVLLDKEEPNLILTGTSMQEKDRPDTIEHSLILAGKERGIFTLSVLDVWGAYSDRFNDLHTGERHKYIPDLIAVMDKYAIADMLKEGFDLEKLVITGNPFFDGLGLEARRFTQSDKEKIRHQIGLDRQTQFFYAGATADSEQDMERYGFWDLDNVQILCNVLDDVDTTQNGVVVKLHPRIKERDSNKILDYINNHQNSNAISLVSEINPRHLILSSDMCLTTSSTLGVEGAYMGRPFISLQPNLKGEDCIKLLTEKKIISAAYTPSECKRLVTRAFLSEDYRRELAEKVSDFKVDGHATERVVGLIYSQLS
ncbi:MAG: hypothetical protein AABW63_02455 [Nanoarchaeota archaeon]